MRYFFTAILTILFSGAAMADAALTAYDFSFKKPNGQELNLSEFKDKVILVVNTASNCGFTKQYTGLESLYEKYKDQGLVVLGVPSNDFGEQEPGKDSDIQSFCRTNFDIKFPIMKKEIVSGENANPFYKWAHECLGFGSAPKWNFHKYLINRQGQAVEYFYSTTKPESSKMVSAIEKLLAEQ